MKRLILSALIALGLVAPASAQITIPNTFTPQTVAQSALVNANFAQLGNLSLNRSGGTLTGNIAASPGVTIDGVDVGALLGGTGNVTFATVTITNTGASALDVAGGINAGTGNVGIVGTDGRIPAISSTFFASLSGANITGILEANITDGTILARVGSAETITGAWLFATTPTLQSGLPSLVWHNTAAGVDAKRWQAVAGATWALQTLTDAGGAGANVIEVGRSGTTPTALILLPTGSTGVLTLNGTQQTVVGAPVFTGLQALTAAAGNNNNVTLNTAYTLNVTPDAGGTSALTGFAGGTAGRQLLVCNVGAAQVTITEEDANSTAANRVATIPGAAVPLEAGACEHLVYSGTLTRWMRVVSAYR